jgi:MFS family permease
VDRLDTWLNAQRGWRRFALLMLQIGPIAVLLAFCCVGASGRSLPPLSLAFAGVVAVGLVGAALLSLLRLWLHARRGRDDRKKRVPLLTWRAMAYTPVMMGPFILIVILSNASPEWHQQHQHALDIAILIFFPCMIFVMIEQSRYMKRLRDR